MYERAAILAAVKRVKEQFQLPELKPRQLEVIMKTVNRSSCFCVLPTGYGKSICFFMPPLVLNLLCPEKKHISVVISPLKSLMMNQAEMLEKKGLRCAILSDMRDKDKSEILSGKVDILFTSPEAILSDYGRQIIGSKVFSDNVCLLAFDEGHCVTEWGQDFRPKYKEVSIVRSFLSKAPVLVLTATSTTALMDAVLDTLMLNRQEVEVVAMVPDRENIRLNVEHARRFEKEFKWYVDVLKKDQQDAPKALVYCRSMTDAAAIYSHILHSVGDRAWLSEKRRADRRTIEIYHSCLQQEDQVRITSEFPKHNSMVRCVVSTIAFGMGVDIPDIKYVIHWGPSKTILDYWQEVGRCARNGDSGEAFLYIVPRSLDQRRVDSDMIKMCKSNDCIRIAILEHLIIPNMDVTRIQQLKGRELCHNSCSNCKCQLCLCCSYCNARCPCNVSVVEALSELTV